MSALTATAKGLLCAFAFFRENPRGKVKVDWCTSWSAAEFRRWFGECLDRKIIAADTRPVPGGAVSDEHCFNLCLDARVINDRAKGGRRCGTNILRTPEMKRAYPHIDNCNLED